MCSRSGTRSLSSSTWRGTDLNVAMPAAASNWPTDERSLRATRFAAAPRAIDKGEIMISRLLPVFTAAAIILVYVQSPNTAAQGRGQAQGQRGAAATAPAAPAPRLPNGPPDLSGVLLGGRGIAERNLKPGDQILRTPEAKKLMDSRLSKDDPEANCLPTGVPRMNPYPWRMIQTPTHKE